MRVVMWIDQGFNAFVEPESAEAFIVRGGLVPSAYDIAVFVSSRFLVPARP